MRLALAIVIVAALATRAGAVDRYAVIVGNNAGGAQDVELRYAEDDARKIQDVLTTLGAFPPENVTLLAGRSADEVRRALIATNDRLRAHAPGDAVLFVYYSGHATAEELHLGRSQLQLAQLEALVRGSSAGMRILVLDACRSGALTRVKGGRPTAPVAIALDDHLAGEGVVFFTASSANEDAQESDEIRGSMFTHHLVSALLGAGDANGDGAVSLGEAYRSAYDATLRASSQTLALQHPTFQLDVHGQGDFVLTRVAQVGRRATLAFPEGRTYLVLRDSRDGPVVAEVPAFAANRRISVAAGTYFVRGRDTAYALEGRIEVAAGAERVVDDGALHRISYPRLVRKGLVPGGVAAVRAGAAARSGIVAGESPCTGAFAGVHRTAATWSIEGRVAGCRSDFANHILSAETYEVGAEIRLGRPYELGPVAFEPAIVAGAVALHQAYATQGFAPPRWAAGGVAGAAGTIVFELGAGFHGTVDVAAHAYAIRGPGTAFAVRGGAGLGRWF